MNHLMRDPHGQGQGEGWGRQLLRLPVWILACLTATSLPNYPVEDAAIIGQKLVLKIVVIVERFNGRRRVIMIAALILLSQHSVILGCVASYLSQSAVNFIPANTKHLYDICTKLDQRRRRWADVVQMSWKCFMFARNMHVA